MKRIAHFTHWLLCLVVLSACAQAVPATPTRVEPSATLARQENSATPTTAATFTMQPATLTATSVPTTTTPPPTPTPSQTATPAPFSVDIQVDPSGQVLTFNRFMLGSNLPAWLKPEGFKNPEFRRRTAASGVTLLRIPGGSWSDEYGWLSCETGRDVPGAYPCLHFWAARPTDFINFFRGVEDLGQPIEPMYVMNFNYTAQEAAAAVAFYNARVGDTTVIGVDRNGVDWKTAGHWAQLRADGGNIEPLGIKIWEIGNEIYGGKAGGNGCGSGWEQTWTCLGEEYMNGDSAHDGFIAQRAAMMAVDPTIVVGAVAGSDSMVGNRWSEAVLRAGADQIDYLSLHTYASYHIYGNLKKEWAEIFALPQYHYPKLFRDAQSALDYYAGGRQIPLVMSEYELVPQYGINDTRNYMNKHINALFLADAIGQMASSGYAMAMQWDLMNGKSDDYGNEFGLMKADGSNFRQPKYYTFVLWSRFGTVLLPVQSSAKAETELSVYAGRLDDGTMTLLVINKTGASVEGTIQFQGFSRIAGGLVDTVYAPSPDSSFSTFNGSFNPSDDLADAPSAALPTGVDGPLTYTFAPYTLTLLRLQVLP